MTPREVEDILSKPWDEATPKEVTAMLWHLKASDDDDLRNRIITWISYCFREMVKEAGRLTDEVRRLTP